MEQQLNWVNFKVAHLMRAVHSVFEGAPASGEDFSNLSFRGLVNGQWSFKGASWCSKHEWWCLLDRVNGAATSWKPIWSSPARGLCPPRASLPHKVKPFFLSCFFLYPTFFWLTSMCFYQVLHEGDCLSGARSALFDLSEETFEEAWRTPQVDSSTSDTICFV